MTRKTKITGLAILLTGLVVFCYSFFWDNEDSRQQSPRRYNIFIIVSDAMRQDALGC